MRLAAYICSLHDDNGATCAQVTVCHSWPALANLVPFQVLFLLRFPMELLRSTSCVPFWCRRHSQMPLSWPKPLTDGLCPSGFPGLLPILVFWAAALVPVRASPAMQAPPKKLSLTLPSYQAQLHLRDPHHPLLQDPCLGATTPILPPILTSQFPLGARSQ